MNLFRAFSVIILFSTLISASCAKSTPPGSSSAGALTVDTTLNNLAARPFGRHTLNATGSGYLTEFMRPDVRAKLDERSWAHTAPIVFCQIAVNNGVIVLYADENTYDLERLMRFVEGGRNQIAELSGIGNERIPVVFGGYRAMPQVELWVIPEGGSMPEFKPDSRLESSGSGN